MLGLLLKVGQLDDPFRAFAPGSRLGVNGIGALFLSERNVERLLCSVESLLDHISSFLKTSPEAVVMLADFAMATGPLDSTGVEWPKPLELG